MEEAGGKNYLPWMLAIVGVFVFLNIDSMWSWSGDLAHHYALAFRISEQWALTSSTDPTLGEMNFYPRGSHTIVAMVGVLLNSTFLGLQVTALIALAVLWLCVLLVLNSLPSKLARVSLATLTALIVINALTTKFDLHGHELVKNYFFAQLVGHAFLLATIVLAIRLEKKFRIAWTVSALAILMLINATIHLLAAMEMLGLIVGLLVVHALFERQPNKSILQRAVVAAPTALLLIGLLFLHPSFSAMRTISENNGELRLHNVPYPIGLVVLCIVALLTSLKLLLQWIRSAERNEILAVKYVSIYGGVTAGLCLLQYALTFFGQGSDYAVKKYVFGLTTILLVQASMILSGYVSKVRKVAILNNGSRLPLLHPLVLVTGFAVALFFSLPAQKSLDVSRVVSTERRLVTLADTLLPVPEDNKNNVVIGLSKLPPTIDYLFSIAIAKTRRDLAIPDVLQKSDLADLSNYSYIVSSRESRKFGFAGCESISKGPLSIVPAQCIENRRLAGSYCKQTFDFSLAGSISPDVLKGFSSPEPHGRWSDGEHASFECTVGDAPVRVLKLQVTPFIHGPLQSQRIEVSLNGRLMFKEMLSIPRSVEDPIVIEIPASMDSSKYTLDFKFPDAKSPKEVGYSDDKRKLGFKFQRVIFE